VISSCVQRYFKSLLANAKRVGLGCLRIQQWLSETRALKKKKKKKKRNKQGKKKVKK
jgi:hypothetical protein